MALLIHHHWICKHLNLNGSGTNIAIKINGAVLMNYYFTKSLQVISLRKVTFRNMNQNIIIVIGVVLVFFKSFI